VQNVRTQIETLYAKIESGEDHFAEIDALTQRVLNSTALVANLHYDPTWINTSTNLRETFDTFISRFQQDAKIVQLKQKFGKALKQDHLIADKESHESYAHAREMLQNHIDSIKSLRIDRPSRLYEVPRKYFEEMPKTRQKKKKFVTADLTQHSNVLLSHVSNERIRRAVWEAMRNNIVSDKKVFAMLHC
jgi:hypothetical protein